MAPRKRGREEMESSEPASEPSLLVRLRDMWEFANLMQYIYIFGEAVKIDRDLEIEDLEQECLKPESSKVLSDIGLALLKFVSSHRGLTPEIFDEYTRRQYVAKAPSRNPFGVEEEPQKFDGFDVFTKIRVLVQLSQWTLINPDRIKERMPDTKDGDQVGWRIEEIGYDRHGRNYYILDDNRLYRRTEPALPTPPKPKPKANSKKARAAARASKRRRLEESEESMDADEAENGETEAAVSRQQEDTFGGFKWECLAVNLAQYRAFLDGIQKSRDPDEKELHQSIAKDVLPVIEKAEESQTRKKQRQERELLNMQRLATAKRSSRLEAKFDREKQEQEAAEAEKKRKEELAEAKKDQERQQKLDEARQSRMMTREQRLKDREYKRVLHEEELANLSEENRKLEAGESRVSERHLKAEMEKKKKDIAALQKEESEWFFDCAKCGVHGTNIDDGSHSVACERCNVWQHSACLGIQQDDAEKDDFHFVCRDCNQREEDAKKPKIPSLKFHVGSSSQNGVKESREVKNAKKGEKRKSTEEKTGLPPSKKFKTTFDNHRQREVKQNGISPPAVGQNDMHFSVMHGPRLSPQGQLGAGSLPPLYAGNTSTPSVDASVPKAPAYTSGNHGKHGRKAERKPKPEVQQTWNPRTTNPDQNIKPPQGILELQASNHYQNGYNSHQSHHSGYQAYQNGYPPGQQNFHSVYQYHPHSYPNQYATFQASPSTQYQSTPLAQPVQEPAHPQPASSQNPYANSFDRLQPSPPVSNPGIPSPLKNVPSLSPPSQHMSSAKAASLSPYSPPRHLQQSSQTPAGLPLKRNGFTSPQVTESALPSGGPAAVSPVKHPSPPSFSQAVPSSHSITNQPPLQPTTSPTSPGISPRKSSPPAPQPTISREALDHRSILPPAPKLLPSPTQAIPSAPLKEATTDSTPPFSMPIEKKVTEAPKLSPSLPPYSSTPPVKETSPEKQTSVPALQQAPVVTDTTSLSGHVQHPQAQTNNAVH